MPTINPIAPVFLVPGDECKKVDPDGVGLCLSGGGYRAMVFHIGSIWRLNELGWLYKLSRISSVSGGSITAGWLALKWKDLNFDANHVATNLAEVFVNPLREMASRTIDVGSIFWGGMYPFETASEQVAKAYEKYLFGKATLQDLPDAPRFIITASNIQTGSLFRFSKAAIQDWRLGEIKNPTLPLATAVAASSAFPPVLSPCRIDFSGEKWEKYDEGKTLPEKYFGEVVLSDGGVYDNMGLEPVWKRMGTVLVSDAGKKMMPEYQQHDDWARHGLRVIDVTDNQVRSLRKRLLMGSYLSTDPELHRKGAYWGIGTPIADYGLGMPQGISPDDAVAMAAIPTRLAGMDAMQLNRLINWGYAITDAAMRRYVAPGAPAPAQLPYLMD